MVYSSAVLLLTLKLYIHRTLASKRTQLSGLTLSCSSRSYSPRTSQLCSNTSSFVLSLHELPRKEKKNRYNTREEVHTAIALFSCICLTLIHVSFFVLVATLHRITFVIKRRVFRRRNSVLKQRLRDLLQSIGGFFSPFTIPPI